MPRPTAVSSKQETLRPLDVPVALALAIGSARRHSSLADIGQDLGLSASTVYEAIMRLTRAGLVNAGEREVNRKALRDFLVHGARYAFPANPGREARGVPTGHAGPPLRGEFDSDGGFVWPDLDGPARGTSLTPLYPQATTLPARAPDVYDALTLVDAIRAGQARERVAATRLLDSMLGASRVGK